MQLIGEADGYEIFLDGNIAKIKIARMNYTAARLQISSSLTGNVLRAIADHLDGKPTPQNNDDTHLKGLSEQVEVVEVPKRKRSRKKVK